MAQLILLINLILLAGYAVVFFLMMRYGCRETLINRDEDYTPRVSIVIPTFNEEDIIEKRIRNILAMDYPRDKIEIVFIDNSSDRTPGIIKGYQKVYPFIKLLRQEKPGFNNALNQGYSIAKGDIVIKSDCDAFPEPSALRAAVSNFADKKVGAVGGVHKILSKSEKSLERKFRGIQYRVQQMESYFHSSLFCHGSFGAYRKSLIPKLGESITADDCELVINVVKNGYRAIFDSDVKSLEWYPENFWDRRKQRDRRAAGVMRVILSNLAMFFNPRYGAFGFISLPLYFFILILSPILLLVDVALLTSYFAIHQPLLLLIIPAIILVLAWRSVTARAAMDTYIGCFLGMFKIFTRNKVWGKGLQKKSRKELSQ
ncbi:MAG: glycosyltransferase [Candidatus Bathyarchaeia archaeon]